MWALLGILMTRPKFFSRYCVSQKSVFRFLFFKFGKFEGKEKDVLRREMGECQDRMYEGCER